MKTDSVLRAMSLDLDKTDLIDIADRGSCAFLGITDQERGGMRSTSRLDVA